MPYLGGSAHNIYTDASNAEATAFMNQASIGDPTLNATLNSSVQALLGVPFRQLPGNVQKLLLIFGPQFMQLIPGAGNAALLYLNMYQQGVTSGTFDAYDATTAAQLAHSLTMVAQNTLYTSKGQLNTQVTHGLSGALAEQVAAQFVGGMLAEKPASALHINLTGTAQTHRDRGKAAMETVNNMLALGQISAFEKEQYDNVVNNIGGSVRSEAALREAFKNGTFEVGGRTYSASKWGDYSVDEKKAITKAALVRHDALDVSLMEQGENQVLKDLQTGGKLKFTDNKVASMSLVNMLASIWAGKAAVDVLDKDSVERISKSMAESLPALNEATAILARAFHTLDFEELQETAKQLNLGSLSSKNDIEKIRDNLNNAFAMAASSNRSIESILTERKSIVEAVSVLEGGAKFVSNQHVINMQRIRNQSQLNDAVGAFKTQEEESAAYQRSYDNASNVYGYIAALQGLMLKNPDLLSPELKAKADDIVKSGIAALSYGDTDMAEHFNKQGMRLWKQMDMTEEQKRWFGKDSIADITNMSAIAGSAGQFAGHLQQVGFEGDRASLAIAYRQGLLLVGTDSHAWTAIIDVLRDGSYKSNSERAAKVRDTLRLSSGADAQLEAIINGIGGAGPQGIAQVANWVLQGGGGASVIGQHTIMRENAAWIKQQMKAGTISTPAASDDPITTFFTSLMSTDQAVTPQDFFKASVVKRMQQSRLGGGEGMTFEQAAAALKKENAAVFGDINYIGEIEGDDKSGYRLSKKGIKELARLMGYEGNVAEFKKKFVQSDGTLDWQGINSVLGADRPLNIAGNRMYLGGKNLASAAAEEQKQLDMLGGLDLTKALAGDLKVDADEVKVVLGESNFKDGTYSGPISAFKGLTEEEISKKLNTSSVEGGPTMAMQIRDRSYKDDTVTEQAVTLLADIKGLIEKLVNLKPSEASSN